MEAQRKHRCTLEFEFGEYQPKLAEDAGIR
jgi:hypothetical protein